jgi:hypothetical protein
MVTIDNPVQVANTGQTITGLGQVTGVNDYFPINSSGQIVFVADIGGNQAVVRAGISGVLPTNLVFDKMMGGVDFQYQVTGGALKLDIPVEFDWATSPKIIDKISRLSYTYTIPSGTPVETSAPINVGGMNLAGAPDNALYLLVVTDPKNLLGNFDPNKNVFALALQLDVPPLYQKFDQSGALTPWANTHLGASPTDTIGNQGCTLTDLAMQLNYAGVATDPGSLDLLLTMATVAGTAAYKVGSDGFPDRLDLPIATTLGAESAGPSQLQWVGADDTTTTQELRDLFMQRAVPILVTVFNPTTSRTHYVLVTGLAQTDDFTINDPGYRARTLLSFYGGFTGVVGYIKDPPVLSILDVSAVSDASNPGVIVVDPQGRSTGTNASTGLKLEQIPNSSVFIDGPQENIDGPQDNSTSTAQFVDIYQAGSGTYTITLMATMPQTFLEITYITPGGVVQKTVMLQGVGGTTIKFDLEGGQITTTMPPSITAPTNQNGMEGVAQAFALGSFTDSASGPWNVDVNWGDGTADTKFSASAAGSVGMQSHTYGEEGTQSVSITVTNTADSLSDSKMFQVAVSDPAVLGTSVKVNAIAGTLFNGAVATFTDPGGAEANDGTHYTASIDWGDKTTPTGGMISVSSGTFTVSGSHTYAPSGPYTITCTINHETIITTVMSSATVGTGMQQPPVVTAAANQNAAEGTAQSFDVGSFSDMGAGPWNVDVKWGDGTADTTFSTSAQGALLKQTHNYTEEGSQMVTVTVSDTADGQSGSNTFQIAVSDPAVLGTAVPVNATSGTAFNGAVSTFTDPGGAEANDGTHYTASIDWGDKTTPTTGTISVSSGTFTVSGSHTYAASGPYTITTSINHETILTTVMSQATVGTASPPVVTAAANQNGAEGATSSLSLGSFTDSSKGPWTVTVVWGDGTTNTTFNPSTTGSLAGQSHTYAEEGTYTLVVSVLDTGDGASGSGSFQVMVSDPAVLGTGVKVSAVAGTAFNGAVATFTDPGGAEANDGTHYTASIDWGDKTTPTSGVISLSSGTFTVSGSHSYAASGPYTITCSINHETIITTVMSSANVGTTGSLAVACVAITPVAGAPFSGVVASFTDGDGDALGNFSAKLNWGDGTTTAGTIAANTSGGFAVSGNHAYATHGPFTLSVEVDDTDGSSGKGTCSITASFTGQFSTANQNATINFWAGTHGQSLIDSFNGGATSTALATWLAASFPNLYGASAGSNNLTGKTNAQVAALFETFYAEARPKPDAQVLASALNIYVTTSSLGRHGRGGVRLPDHEYGSGSQLCLGRDQRRGVRRAQQCRGDGLLPADGGE